ncbi:MAG: di-trans,poly-cis-decaprenylcistransferase [Chloroflexi bacterium]|nr:di-trans,poly-cis-decaprenylcistransferase [Chloroflexota bacterium]
MNTEKPKTAALESAEPPPAEPKVYPTPEHVAIILDGNGRWAKKKGMPRLKGHIAGTQNILRVIEAFAKYGTKYLTLYAFSTENWKRPKEEVKGLLQILRGVIRKETRTFHKQGVRLLHLGRLDRLPKSLQEDILHASEVTKDNSRMTVSVAFDYGGRAEIAEAVKRIVEADVLPEQIDEELIGRYLYTHNLPDPDLIIRTAGEMRLSNFLIWQTAYSEYYFTPTLWPDFCEEDVRKALLSYSQRKRRFGGLGSEE